MRRKLIFLDFDGVLTTLATKFQHGDPLCIAELNRIVERTGAEIVVSSTWRMAGLDAVKQNLSDWGCKGRVIGITPRLDRVSKCGVDMSPERGIEILRWLDEHKAVMSFVILDDDADMAAVKHRLIQTNSRLGLTAADADKAIMMLA